MDRIFEDTIKKMAGKGYRVVRGEDGFYQVVLNGKRGHIYQHGPETLAAHITGTTRPARTFKAIRAKCLAATLHVMGEDALIVLHPMEEWESFFTACRARTRRTLTAEERKKAGETLRQFQFRPAVEGGVGVVEPPIAV